MKLFTPILTALCPAVGDVPLDPGYLHTLVQVEVETRVGFIITKKNRHTAATRVLLNFFGISHQSES